MNFDPNKSLADGIRIIENAVIVPFGAGKRGGIRRPAAIYDAGGNYVPLGQCFRSWGRPVTVEPDSPPTDDQIEPTLPGTWLFGGMIYTHFGHFLVETTSRLWALDHLDTPPDGVIFMPRKQAAKPERFISPVLPLLDMFGKDVRNVRAVVRPKRVERLILAPQGFGTGDMMGGSPEFRAYIARHLGDGIEPQGGEKLYISRSRLFSKRGRYLGEKRLEQLFEAEGYEVFHPQDHTLAEQIARYKAASKIVSSDSSALHLAAFFTRPDDRIAIILRRPGKISRDFVTQFRHFANLQPVIANALNGRIYRADNERKQMNEVFAELDFPSLGTKLAETGFITDPSAWTGPTEAELEAERNDLSERLGLPLVLG
ncbi:glycosyltransferase family 61 protein [Paracoccus aurantiacus]|uniref:Glycosyltransferase family 61 protein n=1 Tax=Paracoccus aurantiacus TaxID=2599412 RepID=A0A5C6RZN8_9RHOB|nr:glycosyltransferase 61 family protein [Paracoccus aurantiacus]TXB67868.1 glycosyltransferase family 61 protein [Paracoccus aurantiacus]